ncbi:T9SS type A sorting domain-containing protein [Ilyomonas limi]|uniref:T9SS type A sorting domain-containing protein n=1 Tax=Ilyomonas limi TaxID=2575867 RepID=A0A4U3L2T0_9BACT|nr:choice-of-anchor tandem repeat GloVer-containing protein [Ilyomonas limi]TKK69338.1 T9SS type A sorting domain-containing protein [Ilyomonas limi]
MQQNNFTQLLTRSIFLLLIGLTTLLQPASAQTVLTGLTSNGGPDGKGTAFTINTNGSNFSLIQNFADWGKTPTGSLLKGDDGKFYGMTSSGGTYGYGSVFSMSATGAVTMLKQFNYTTDGAYPDGELIKGADGNLYGVTPSGGITSYGTIFKISTSGAFSVIKNFNYSTDGAHPNGHLVLASDGNYYGTTYSGGANSAGTIYKLTPGGVFTVIHNMNMATEGGNSYSSLTEGTDGNLYGLAYYGGTYNYGTVFKITKTGNLTVLKHLNGASDGGYPQSDLIQAKDGNFYGTCYSGGTGGNGTIFKITPSGVYTVLKNLSASKDGGNPYGALLQNTDGAFYGMTRTGGAYTSGTIYKLVGNVYTVIHSLQPATEGSTPNGALIKGNDASLYALASLGGTYNMGTAFKVTTAGAVTLLTSFNGATLGNEPYESFIKGKDSAYYATTSKGGAYGYGTIIKMCGGNTTVLFSFNRSISGGNPKGSLVQASDGNLYGTASEGGNNNSGVIFKITPTGNYTVLRHLNSSTDGSYPQGGLIQATDGFLYGMNSSGGANGGGTIFKIALGGAYTVVRHLAYATDGSSPQGGLVQATDGSLYGMTTNNGKIFKLTLPNTFTVLHTFNSSTDGYNPQGSLIQGKDGNLYGTCSDGGSYSAGTIFKASLTGTLKVLRYLNATTDGRMPKGSLVQGPDGVLYGTTSIGGKYNTGTIFKITSGGAYTVLRHLNLIADGGNPYGSLIFAPVNNLVANPQSVTTDQGKAVAITLSGSGGSSLTYTISAQPKNGTISGTGANRTYTPNAGYSGADSFSFKVSIGCMASAPAKVKITVKPATTVNHAPVLDTIKNKTVIVNNTLKFKATAADVDAGQTLTFSLRNAPAGSKINAGTGVFSWTPTATGTYTATIRVTDNGTPAMYDEQAFTIKVNPATTLTANTMAGEATMKTGDDELFSAKLYPNPVHNTCNLQMNTGAETIIVTVADAKGSIVINKQLHLQGASSASLDVATLASGMYFLTVQTDNNRQTIKFIKQ